MPVVTSPPFHGSVLGRARFTEMILPLKFMGSLCYSLDVPRYDYNLVVIGGGPAGEKGAAQVAYFGLPDSVIPESCAQRTHDDFRVALVEREAVLGGAWINTGTLPSKTLRE